MPARLTDRQVADYHRNGFAVVDDFAGADSCSELIDAGARIVSDFVPADRPTMFTTGEDRQSANREFLDSAAGVACFFEQGAFAADGTLAEPQDRSVNKIGHALHDVVDEFRRFTYSGELAAVAADIGIDDALALQSMLIFKQPFFGGEVTCHQDATFLYTDPITVTGFWLALEDADETNGCLWVEPGGHRGPLRSLFKRDRPGADAETSFETLDDTPWPATSELQAVPVAAGSLVLLHGLLPHWSDVNRSPRSRQALSIHCISAAAEYPWFNWLQRPANMPLRRLDHEVAA